MKPPQTVAEANRDLTAAGEIDRLRAVVAWAKKMVDWLEKQAAKDLKDAETCHFSTLVDAYRADAKNYLAMARDGKAALATIAVPSQDR